MPADRRSVTLGELAGRFGGEVLGDPATAVSQVAPLDAAGPDDISFLTAAKYRRQLESSRAGAVILGPDDRDVTSRPRIIASNPYLFLARVSGLLNPPHAEPAGIHPSAAVAADAVVAPTASIGPNAVIESGARVGERTRIGPGCVIGRGASVGDDGLLHANVVVCHGCVVGHRAVLHPGVVIGGDGFGMAEDGGKWVKVPQIGRAVLGDDVEVGANTTIDRGALGDTVLEDGVKLDNLIQIAHNVILGAHTAVAACAGFAGSSRIGRYCRIGGAAMIHGHIEICDGTVVAAGTMVRKSITERGMYDGFFPALPHKEWMKNLANFNRLHELADTLRALVSRVERLETAPPAVPHNKDKDA